MSNWLLKRCITNLKRVTDELVTLVAEPERPSRTDADEPPRRKRQSELGGVDMNDLLRQAERERRSRRLPRSPEEARGRQYNGLWRHS